MIKILLNNIYHFTFNLLQKEKKNRRGFGSSVGKGKKLDVGFYVNVFFS